MSYDINLSMPNLYNQWGYINARGLPGTKLTFLSAVAETNITLENLTILFEVRSKYGSVSASLSTLKDVLAQRNIHLIDSTANSVKSERANIHLNKVTVNGPVTSGEMSIIANQSTLGDINAYHNIDLTNSCAGKLTAKWGSVFVRQTVDGLSTTSDISAHDDVNVDGVSVNGKTESKRGNVKANRSTLGDIKAHNFVNLINSSAAKVESQNESVTVRQTDGIKREISHITGRNSVVAENSTIGGITLFIDNNQKAILDLSNTQVTDQIVVKLSATVKSCTHVAVSIFSRPMVRYVNQVHSSDTSRFSLLVKGTELPKNLSFEGFTADEIATEATADGILVTGKKK